MAEERSSGSAAARLEVPPQYRRWVHHALVLQINDLGTWLANDAEHVLRIWGRDESERSDVSVTVCEEDLLGAVTEAPERLSIYRDFVRGASVLAAAPATLADIADTMYRRVLPMEASATQIGESADGLPIAEAVGWAAMEAARLLGVRRIERASQEVAS